MSDTNPYAPTPVAPSDDEVRFEQIEAPREVAFEFGEEDYIAAMTYVSMRVANATSQVRRFRKTMRKLSVLLLCAAIVSFVVDSSEFLAAPLGAMLFAVAAFGSFYAAIKGRAASEPQVREAVEKSADDFWNKQDFGLWRQTITTEGISIESRAGSRFRRWWVVDRVELDGEQLYI